MNFRFWLNTDVSIGPEASLQIFKYIKENNPSNIAIIIDHGVRENPQVKKILHQAKLIKREIQIEYLTVAEADYEFLDLFRQKFRKTVDLFVAIGGGSALDVTKAMSVLLVNKKPAIHYRGFGKIKKEGPPIIAVPTTAGTGSEITPNASFIDRREMKKMGINSDLYIPKLALLDPLLTLTCPKSVTVGSGMDSVIHALEAYTAKAATQMSKIFSREALRILLRDLPLVVEDPGNVYLRQNLQLGALLAGVAMINSSGSLTAALSYPLGVHFNVPHGMAGAVYLAKVVRMNFENGADIYGELVDILPVKTLEGSKKQRAKVFVEYFEKMSKSLGVPDSITKFGVSKKDLAMLTDELMTFTGALDQNPVKYSKNTLQKFMYSMI